MPQSDHWAVPWVVEMIDWLQPRSVFDFGVGMGQFGLHVRQTLDIARQRLKPQDWQVHLEGVEIFENYRNPIWDYFYNQVHIGDGAEILRESSRKWDVLLICDVIEHFPRAKALELLELLQSRATTVVVTTPNGVLPQGCVHGNEAERHLSEWRPGDFQALGASTREIATTFLAVFSSDPATHRMVRKIPALFHYTGRELMSLTREWFPHMLRSRLGQVQ